LGQMGFVKNYGKCFHWILSVLKYSCGYYDSRV
jgi:hypothetical protein